MTREIKFRAWDKLLGKMVTTGFHILGETTVFDMLSQHFQATLDRCSLIRLNDAVIMQYTGLLDKNGKEVYEGDILKCAGPVSYQVVKDYDRWGLVDSEGKHYDNGDYYRYDDIAWEVFEVIGNIYENPELLKEELL